MASATEKPELLVIVGPTASGKSSLAMKIAEKYNGEIICADSLTIYKDMDIGTAKPTKTDRKKVKHWALDLVGPGYRFTASEFKNYAEEAIKDIRSRGKLPVLVGGTGLYIDGLLFDFSFVPRARLENRHTYSRKSVEELQKIIRKNGYPMPENSKNRRHLVGIIEREGVIGSKTEALPEGIILIGLMPDNDELKTKINLRVNQMFTDGLVQETRQLLKEYGRESLLSKAKVAYGSVIEYLYSDNDLDKAKEKLKTAHWQYARRQKTWFKRNKFIQWFADENSALSSVDNVLNNRVT